MKFGETLATHLTPEWRKQYISYSMFKQMILNAIANMPAEMNPRSTEYKAYVANFDEEFFEECEKELLKIDTFFAEKRAEAKRKFRELSLEVQLVASDVVPKKNFSTVDLSSILPKRKTKQLKLVLSEYYLSLILLRNYQTLNVTGFRKILKKHDKNFNLKNGAKFFKTYVEAADFARNTDIQKLLEETETIFTNYLESGDRSRAMKYLRVPPFEELQSPWRTFRLGFALGVFCCILYSIYVTITAKTMNKVEYESCTLLHRGSFLIIFFIFLIGLNVHGWRKAGVNHILIFEIDPRDHLSAAHLMEIAVYFGVLWGISFLACLQKVPYFVPPHVYPVILAILMILYWLNPIPIQWSSRFWLMKVVGRIISSPCFEVGFADFWLADQFISLVNGFIDFQFLLCFCISRNWSKESDGFSCLKGIQHITNSFIASLPAWWRLAQSFRRYFDTRRVFPFLVNAGKYATTFPWLGFWIAFHETKERYGRAIENPYFWGYIVSRSVSSIASYAWDILMDFGVFKKFSGENIFLRDEIIYAPAFYYFAIIEDLLLRFFWLWGLFFVNYGLIEYMWLTTISGILEVIRRHIWNFIRLENEHLNNAGHFRAVRDISVRLVLPDDQKRLEIMMDKRDGVYNRHGVSTRRESEANQDASKDSNEDED